MSAAAGHCRSVQPTLDEAIPPPSIATRFAWKGQIGIPQLAGSEFEGTYLSARDIIA